MVLEAELFVMAERMLVEVLGRIRPGDHDIVLPAMSDRLGTDRPLPLWRAVEEHALDDSRVPGLLAGRGTDEVTPGRAEGSLVSDNPQPRIAQLAEAACAAVRRVDDADADTLVPTGDGDLSKRELLTRLTLTRSFLAHYVAAYLGSTACPLPEELARPLWELTAPDARTWRSLGYFREPMPLPDHVSWRDRLLLTAGHLPHPLGH